MPIRNSYGKVYIETDRATRLVTPYYAIKRLKTGSWLVYEGRTGEHKEVLPTRFRAYYMASRLNGLVKDVFWFGDLLCS